MGSIQGLVLKDEGSRVLGFRPFQTFRLYGLPFFFGGGGGLAGSGLIGSQFAFLQSCGIGVPEYEPLHLLKILLAEHPLGFLYIL